jgi:anthranilate phosphoribosyltransferase
MAIIYNNKSQIIIMKQKIQFVAGICIALIGAGIMFHGNIFGESNSGIATVIGIIGIALIATSKFRLLK